MRLRPTQLGGKHVTRMRRVPKPSVTNKQPFNLGPASRRESAADRTPHASSAQPLPAQPQAAIDTLTQEPSKAGESGGVSVRSLDARSVLQPRSTGETAQPAQPQAEPEAPPAAAAPEAPPAAAAPYIVQHDLAVPSSGSTGAAVTAAQHNATSTGPNSEVVLSEKAKDVPAVPNEAAQVRPLQRSSLLWMLVPCLIPFLHSGHSVAEVPQIASGREIERPTPRLMCSRANWTRQTKPRRSPPARSRASAPRSPAAQSSSTAQTICARKRRAALRHAAAIWDFCGIKRRSSAGRPCTPLQGGCGVYAGRSGRGSANTYNFTECLNSRRGTLRRRSAALRF